jgi:hypothetical protein
MCARTRFAVAVVVAGLLAISATAASAAGPGAASPFCKRLGHSIEASSGAQMWCFGSQPSGTGALGAGAKSGALAGSPFSANVNAASLSEDVTPAGARLYGQSETSIAAASPYVVEAWNDATAFATTCPAPMFKEEGTGYGFSANSGASFVDEGGVTNPNCNRHLDEGDPSVEAWHPGGKTYFYISSLFPTVNFVSAPSNDIGLNACKVTGSGSSAGISCAPTIPAAKSTQCSNFFGFFCSFLDKEYLALDASRGRLYVVYTEFGPSPDTSSFNGEIELAVCDIGTPSGGVGPAGGTAGKPVCEHGTSATTSNPITKPYFVVAPGDPNCEHEGAYPAVDSTTGDVYIAHEFNIDSNIFNPACFSTPTTEILARIPLSCLKLQTISPCSGPAQQRSQTITSMDAAFVPGYNRFPANDFPRIVADPITGTVSMVWNDARTNPLGDILLRSYALGTLSPVQAAPVRLNTGTEGLHFLPAVRNPSPSGKIGVIWYDRTTPSTTITNVRAALNLDPRLAAPPSSNVLVTSAPSDWNAVSSDIVPNFGDYTDDYANNGLLYAAWSDGRLGLPQPFEAHAPMP